MLENPCCHPPSTQPIIYPLIIQHSYWTLPEKKSWFTSQQWCFSSSLFRCLPTRYQFQLLHFGLFCSPRSNLSPAHPVIIQLSSSSRSKGWGCRKSIPVFSSSRKKSKKQIRKIPRDVDRAVQGQEEGAGGFVRAPRVQRDAVPRARDDRRAAGAARGIGPGTWNHQATGGGTGA